MVVVWQWRVVAGGGFAGDDSDEVGTEQEQKQLEWEAMEEEMRDADR